MADDPNKDEQNQGNSGQGGSNENDSNQGGSGEGFDLSEPSPDSIDRSGGLVEMPSDKMKKVQREREQRTDDSMPWKGFEVEPEPAPEEQGLRLKSISSSDDDDLDMTPMVDVTFLLLIFFIVTASFKVQMGIQQPPTDQPSYVVEEDKDNDDYVEVYIDRYNSYWVSTRDEDGVAAPSDPEMRNVVIDRVSNFDVQRMVILAHNDSVHEKVITAYDAGVKAGIGLINIKYTEEDKY